MTIEELADKLGVKKEYLKKHWNKVVNSREKEGIKVWRKGRGIDAEYFVQFPGEPAPPQN